VGPSAAAPLAATAQSQFPPVLPKKHPKLDSRLLEVASSADTAGVAAGVEAARARRLSLFADNVRVAIRTSGDHSLSKDAVRSVGGVVDAEYADVVQAFVPTTALRRLADNPAAVYVGLPLTPIALAVVEEGVTATNANAWQAAGWTGAGVKVGVIDLGFIGYTAKQASGDLPSSLTTADFGCSGLVNAAAPTDHGTAVSEIVYKMAPGTQLYLICIATPVNLGQAKDYALAQGITVINHSVGWPNSSRGDGAGGPSTPEGIAADARAHGVLWVNAAGNQAQRHWSGNFIDANGNRVHEFAMGDEFDRVFIPAGLGICAGLKWDAWPTTSQDYDLFLVLPPTLAGTAVASSFRDQTGTQPPTEDFCYTNSTGLSQTFGLAITKFCPSSGCAPSTNPRFDLVIDPGTLQYAVAAGSVIEPATSPSVMAVGAICWQNDSFEPYSSQGPTIDGRTKPDIAAPDATSSSVYGPASACNAGFKGSSASSPHIAGAAALVLQANPTFTASQLQIFLESRAVRKAVARQPPDRAADRDWDRSCLRTRSRRYDGDSERDTLRDRRRRDDGDVRWLTCYVGELRHHPELHCSEPGWNGGGACHRDGRRTDERHRHGRSVRVRDDVRGDCPPDKPQRYLELVRGPR